jgi:hypothetical protein
VKPSVEQLENLLALKRHELPEDGYWQDFLREFHHRQRQQAVAASGLSGMFTRVSAWFSDLGSSSRWAYGAGLAYAAVTIAFFLIPRGVEVENAPAAPVNYQVVPAAPPVEQLDQLDLSPETQGSAGEQVF